MPTVFVVDDNAEFALIIAEFLRHKGYQVQEARSGEAAIEILNSAPVDVVIADLYLPGPLNGVDILSHHRRLAPKGCRILFTAALSDRLRSVCEYIDAVYVEKPFPLDKLVDKIESLLQR